VLLVAFLAATIKSAMVRPADGDTVQSTWAEHRDLSRQATMGGFYKFLAKVGWLTVAGILILNLFGVNVAFMILGVFGIQK
jgi:hypothetical protein